MRPVELLQDSDAAVGVEGEDRELRLAQLLEEALPICARVTRDDLVPPLEEAVLLLDRLHALVHLAFPEIDDLLGPYRPAPLQRLLQRENPRVRDEEVLLQVSHGLEQRLDRLRGPLHDVLERRDPLKQMLVERNLLLRLGRILDDPDAREHEKLGVAAGAELLVVRVPEAAHLAVHGCQLSAMSCRL